MKRNYLIILALILLIGSGFRFYNLTKMPPSLSWDEASNGYDGWAVINYGKDHWGHTLPLTFASFGDDKHPVHTYITGVSEKIFGLNEFATRLPAAALGVINILLIYLLAFQLFKKRLVALFSAASLAISPYGIQFSRADHEAVYALFFFMLGSLLFFKGLEKGRLLGWSFAAFGISLLTYHSAKVVIPPLIIFLCVFFQRELRETKKYFLGGLVILTAFVIVMLVHPELLGTARINQTSFSDSDLRQSSSWYRQTSNQFLGRAQITGQQYLSHFTSQYLFISGDKNARHSTQEVGEFFWLDLPFMILGVIGLLWQRSKRAAFVLLWAFIAPLPASLVSEAPHAARSLFMMGSWHLIIGFGIYMLVAALRVRKLQIAAVIVLTLIYGWFFNRYWNDYLYQYNTRYAIEWQYGMKDIVEYVKTHPNYHQVNMTAERHQPYIFFLYYLKTPPDEFLETAQFNEGPSKSYNLISSYGKFHFGDWQTVDSAPSLGVLYVLTPTEYSGLRSKDQFMVKKKITYPNGSDAFFLVSYN